MNDIELFDAEAFDQATQASSEPLPIFREALHTANQILKQQFIDGADVRQLVILRSWMIDQLLTRAYSIFIDREGIALIAVGGYGRGELHPNSDVDIMVLLATEEDTSTKEQIENFLIFLFDLGPDIGHSVRTVKDCIAEAGKDITVATNLMESRLLMGTSTLFEHMRQVTGQNNMWSSRDFFAAKWQEQIIRHHKFHDTTHNLEPNIKEGPGGLRDIQMIAWVAQRHFGTTTLHDLVEYNFLTETEYMALLDGQDFLWKIRYALHLLCGRREDYLLFDYQRTLATQFGYRDDAQHLGVEHFMKQYYRTIMELQRLNEMLLELFQEVILYARDPGIPVPINKRFQARKGFVEVKHEGIFKQYPLALLEIFLLLAQHPEFRGVRASTIRLIRNHRYLIDNRFRDDLSCRSLFMEIIRQPRGVTHELRRMNRYGILAAYIPMFGNIVGQMQYDLFHHYTVDAHTLFVIRNLRRFTVPRYAHEFPLCSKLIRNIPKPEILYLAGLFHDIAKGRGGDHSDLGAPDARTFCLHHGLSKFDADLVAWLVQQHLLMSTTSQRKDISDPEVVTSFAAAVGNQERLEYLYLLTVADIRATNPELWNTWKDALLTELFMSSSRAIRRGLEQPIDQRARIKNVQLLARYQLKQTLKLPARHITALWRQFGEDYFLRHSSDRIAWHAQAILEHAANQLPLVLIRSQQPGQQGGTEIFIYTRDQDNLFAIVTTALDQLGLNIVDARIITALNGYTLDTCIVLEQSGEPINNQRRFEEITAVLTARLKQPGVLPRPVTRRVPRQLKHFPIATEVTFRPDPHNPRTIMEVVAADRPGLLSQIGLALAKCSVRLKNAKIATFGERAEDIFFITDKNNQALQDETQFTCLRETIRQSLDSATAKD